MRQRQIRLLENKRQILRLDKDKIYLVELCRRGKIIKRTECKIPLATKRKQLLFNKISRYGTDVCALCEIILDNVLKR